MSGSRVGYVEDVGLVCDDRRNESVRVSGRYSSVPPGFDWDDSTEPLSAQPLGKAFGASRCIHVVHSPDPDCPALMPLGCGREVVIGRRAQSGHFSIRDPSLSRTHARLVPLAGGLRITDENSRNGTFVNGRPVATATVSSGGLIRVGQTLVVYVEGDAMCGLRLAVERVAPLEVTLLIQGETGSGKDILARRIHERSGRRGAFIPVNCATLPRDLAAAELFGHTRGAFSGADRAGTDCSQQRAAARFF